MGIMRIQDRTGDTEVTWNTADTKSVDVAEKIFAGLMANNHMAYKTDQNGGGEVIKAFDPTVDEIIVAVPLTGG